MAALGSKSKCPSSHDRRFITFYDLALKVMCDTFAILYCLEQSQIHLDLRGILLYFSPVLKKWKYI